MTGVEAWDAWEAVECMEAWSSRWPAWWRHGVYMAGLVEFPMRHHRLVAFGFAVHGVEACSAWSKLSMRHHRLVILYLQWQLWRHAVMEAWDA